MFIEQYRLDRNPFAEDSVRPLFVSQSMREISELIRELAKGKLQTLLITGAAGAGKTTLLAQRSRGFKDVPMSWIGPDVDSPEKLYSRLVQEIGPGAVSGTPEELKHILEVYLAHQRGQDRTCVIIVDSLERHRQDVVSEIRSLLQLRSKSLPLVQAVFLTRNDELVDEIIAEHEGGGSRGKAGHIHLSGFTLEETQSYIRICLQGAGCEWANELMPDNVLLDVQALTQGIVGDINKLCAGSLEQLARVGSDPVNAPRLTTTIVRAIGKKLHLHYNPDNWVRTVEETLSPDAVQIHDHSGIRIDSAHLVVSSGGRELAQISLNRPRMILGRDPGCDISLESTYLSRFQNLFMQTNNGWMIIDLNSTNGCFVNGRRVREHRLRDGDSISVGHHLLRFSAVRPESRPDGRLPAKAAATPGDDTISTDVSEEREQWTGS